MKVIPTTLPEVLIIEPNVISDSADFLYKTTAYYAPEFERSILWNDPSIDIQWHTENEPILFTNGQHAIPLVKTEYFV